MRSNAVYDDVLGLLPGVDNPAPMVRINRLNPVPGFLLYGKLERVKNYDGSWTEYGSMVGLPIER